MKYKISTALKRDNIVERFWSKVNKTDTCWLWVGAKQTSGYGRFWDGERNDGAHRFSYRLNTGEIPEGKAILHTCDNPCCVNPYHLKVGTQKENMQDMYEKNRNRSKDTYKSGAEHCNAKLTSEDVIDIRRLYKAGEYSSYELGDKYDVHRTTINRIIREEIYKHE